MIHVETPQWPGWEPHQIPGAGPSYAPGIGACLKRTLWGGVEEVRVYISWGPSAQHTQARAWRSLHSTDWYIDLEAFALWPSDPVSRAACHIERRFKTRKQARAAVEWLRSCVELCGVEGLRALNARTGGRLA